MTKSLFKTNKRRVEDHRLELQTRKIEREKNDLEKKELLRLLERLIANAGFLRGRCGEMETIPDFPGVYARTNDALLALAEVYRRLF